MDIIELMDNKGLKPIQKREALAESIRKDLVTMKDIEAWTTLLDDKKMVIVLEAMEAVSNKQPEKANLHWLKFTQEYIASPSNNLKREASRIVGNIAHLFPDALDVAIDRLMENMKAEGTVIRWSGAYALARIVQIPQYANGELYHILTELSELEQENGVKNQLLSGLKKAGKIR